MRLFPIVAATMAIAAPVLGQDRQPVTLTPEQAITLSLDENGATLARENPGAAEWTPYDLAVARLMAGIAPPKAPVQGTPIPADAVPPMPALQQNRLRLRFMSIAGQHTLLILENGYDRAIVFRARITSGGRTRTTDVCLVRPALYGFEHWPDPLDRIEISDIHFVPWRAGDPVPCA